MVNSLQGFRAFVLERSDLMHVCRWLLSKQGIFHENKYSVVNIGEYLLLLLVAVVVRPRQNGTVCCSVLDRQLYCDWFPSTSSNDQWHRGGVMVGLANIDVDACWSLTRNVIAWKARSRWSGSRFPLSLGNIICYVRKLGGRGRLRNALVCVHDLAALAGLWLRSEDMELEISDVWWASWYGRMFTVQITGGNLSDVWEEVCRFLGLNHCT